MAAQFRLKRKVDAIRWISTNTAEVVDWVRRFDDASVQHHEAFAETESGKPVAKWMQMPEHLVILNERMGCVVVPYAWIIHDERGHYRVISDEQFGSDFDPAT